MTDWNKNLDEAPKDGTLIDIVIENRDGRSRYRITDVMWFEGNWCNYRRCPQVSHDDEWLPVCYYDNGDPEPYADVVAWQSTPEIPERKIRRPFQNTKCKHYEEY